MKNNSMVRQTLLLLIKALIWGVAINLGLQITSEPSLSERQTTFDYIQGQTTPNAKAYTLDAIDR